MKHWSGSAQLDPPAGPQPTGTGGAPMPRTRLWLAHLIGLCVGVAGIGCAVALPFAPVWLDRTDVHWPNGPVESTTAFFAPYRPAEFDATVPCSALRAALDRPHPTAVLSTLPPGSDRDGLVLTTRQGRPELLLGQREIPLPPLGADCGLRIHADGHGSLVAPGGQPPIALPGILPPEIFTFSTDLGPQQAAGISVDAHPYSWFDTTSTELKTTLVAAAIVLAALSLGLLLAHAPPSPATLVTARFNPTAPVLVDAAVLAVLGLWLVIGPTTDDDGFAMMTVRNYADSGDIGNYYRWFNASEAPFTLVQHLMRWVSAHSLAPAWLRVPSVVAGVLTWLLASRGVAEPLCRGTRRLPLHLVTAVFFLACWLPFGLGIRPEPFVALGMTALVAALLKAERSQAPLFWLGTAALVAGLTVAVTPTGVAAVLTVLVFAGRIWRIVVRRDALTRWIAIPARVALLGCLGSVGLVAMFADSTWNGVRRATEIHDEFGPSLGWYQEFERYAALLGTTFWGNAGKRLAVFLVLTALLLTAACLLRQVHRWARTTDLPLLVGSVAAVFVALWLTPSKWSHHFGAFAGVGAALLATTTVVLARLGRLRQARREARLLGVVGGLAAAAAAAVSFSGPNQWPTFSRIAVPWADTPIRPGGLPLDSPVAWLAVGAACGAGAYALVRLRALLGGAPRPGHAWTVVPSSILSLAALTSVAVLLGSFLAVPRVMGERFSLARTNVQSLRGSSCGIENQIEAVPFAHRLFPVQGAADLDGFTPGGPVPQDAELRADRAGGPLRPVPHADDEKPAGEVRPVASTPFTWTSGAPQNTGTLTTQWFALPGLGSNQALGVWLAGRPEQGNSVSLEFGTADGRRVRPVHVQELRDPPPTELPFDDPKQGRPQHWRDFRPWRLFTVDARDVPPGADRVRVHAVDRTTDEQGWLRVSAPSVRDVVPLSRVLDGQQPELIDWSISFLFPCRFGYPDVGHGLAASPGVLVSPGSGEWSMTYDPQWGGVFAGVPMMSQRFEVPARLRDAPGVNWGHVYAVSYDVPRDAYATTRHREVVGGADGDGPYPFTLHQR
ncbi:arabinosyltransferase domain-containing protein [Saccharopolyspora rosea]|uniref:arabinosyltransferase domain-containing protein n=1 Tax=Saccharopolyspora rosea TaxID=524884 RepID=UPI0021D9B0FB|nr:arabinosyltransferase domain-containing protein [Saccharopolyspora rosea]